MMILERELKVVFLVVEKRRVVQKDDRAVEKDEWEQIGQFQQKSQLEQPPPSATQKS